MLRPRPRGRQPGRVHPQGLCATWRRPTYWLLSRIRSAIRQDRGLSCPVRIPGRPNGYIWGKRSVNPVSGVAAVGQAPSNSEPIRSGRPPRARDIDRCWPSTTPASGWPAPTSIPGVPNAYHLGIWALGRPWTVGGSVFISWMPFPQLSFLFSGWFPERARLLAVRSAGRGDLPHHHRAGGVHRTQTGAPAVLPALPSFRSGPGWRACGGTRRARRTRPGSAPSRRACSPDTARPPPSPTPAALADARSGSRAESARESANAPAALRTAPVTTRNAPSRRTSHKTWGRSALSASPSRPGSTANSVKPAVSNPGSDTVDPLVTDGQLDPPCHDRAMPFQSERAPRAPTQWTCCYARRPVDTATGCSPSAPRVIAAMPTAHRAAGRPVVAGR